ncbi:MAG: hypothetical protein P4L34_08415 [Paludibacter sp.]|nr:hypothetical protein [Paludibacter sp.]
MNKRQKNIFIWIFTWAGLLLAVLYSPIGSPDLYTSKSYFIPNQGVVFNGGEIKNAPAISQQDGNNYNELDVPDYSSNLKTNYAVNNYPSSTYKSSTPNTYSVQTPTNQNPKASSGADIGSGGVFISNNSSGRSSANSNTVVMNNGITTMSTNLVTGNVRQLATNGTLDTGGGTDPGGDPTNPPIPVPDGWGFLLLLAAGYGILKQRFKF